MPLLSRHADPAAEQAMTELVTRLHTPNFFMQGTIEEYRFLCRNRPAMQRGACLFRDRINRLEITASNDLVFNRIRTYPFGRIYACTHSLAESTFRYRRWGRQRIVVLTTSQPVAPRLPGH